MALSDLMLGGPIFPQAAGLFGVSQSPSEQGLLGISAQSPGGMLGISETSDSPSLLESLYSQYPGLKKFDIQLKDSTTAGTDWRGEPYAGRKMEFYPPDESYNPNPGKPTIELFANDVSSKDALGEVFSHYLPSVDPQFRDARAKFIASIDPKQKNMLMGDYRSQLQSGVYPEGEEPTFDEWLDTNGGDAFFRGYVADQYPKEFYRPDQIRTFESLMHKLSE